jgi:exodeoxyribonuclease V gamma subunit
VIPPSTIINDLKSYLETRFKLPPPKKTWDEKTDLSSFETLHHLQPFHADYFKENNDGLFSCSEENLNGAIALLKSKSNLQTRASTSHAIDPNNTTDSDWSITLEELCKFLENPAKTYFTETLKVRFNENKETLLIDDEMFEATSLDAYTLNQTILERMLLNQTPLHTPPPLFSQELMQRALLPLGDSGVITLGDKWDELHDFLNSELSDYEGNLRALLLEKKEKQPISIDFGDSMKLTGHVEVFLIGTQKIYLAMRYSTLKAKDQLRAWIRHLALSAQELCVKTILVSTDKDKNLTTKTFPTLTKPESLKILQPLLHLFKQGKSKPLPFALETSLEYCKQLQKNPEAIEKALNSALKKWSDNEHSPGDSKDPYLYRAFGENSPTAVEEFHVCAKQVFEVLLKLEESPKKESVDKAQNKKGKPT